MTKSKPTPSKKVGKTASGQSIWSPGFAQVKKAIEGVDMEATARNAGSPSFLLAATSEVRGLMAKALPRYTSQDHSDAADFHAAKNPWLALAHRWAAL